MTTPRIDVVGLGPSGAGLMSADTVALVESHANRLLRTGRHPAAATIEAPTCDDLYETGDSFAEVYEAIVARVIESAERTGRLLYAVPGSPGVAEHTVELLRARDDVEVVVHPAMSFIDLAWVVLGIDPIAHGVRIIDGHRFAEEAAGQRGPLLVTQCHSREVLSDIKLAIDVGDDVRAVLLQRLGLDDEHVVEVPWSDLDRSVEPDHLTSLYIPSLPSPVGDAFARFGVLVERLRRDCPWDAEQDHGSLRRYLLEESYETLEALDRLVDDEAARELPPGDLDERYADLQEELGDLLYQVFFHSILAEEQGWFSVAEVADGIHDKLYTRHPHVFGDVETTLDELSVQWESAKKIEKGRESVMDGIPAALPALIYATKVQKKAATVGEAPPGGDGIDADDEDAVARLLFDVVARARALGIDPESALRQHAVRFADRVRNAGA